MTFAASLTRGAGFTDKEWSQHLEAAYWWAKCWNDPLFQRQVLDFKFSVQQCTGALWWKKCRLVTSENFTYTDDDRMTVLAKMLAAAEVLKPVADGIADVEVIVGNQRGVLGWTYPTTLKEWVSRWFLDGAEIWELAGNRAHEYMHKLGFDHPFRSTWDRPYSVPYAIGYMTEAWVKTNYVAGEYKPA